MRILLALLLWSVGACDPYRSAAIAVAPPPASSADTLGANAFAIMARVAAEHGLEPYVPRGPEQEIGWRQCFALNVMLCGKILDSEAQFLVVQKGAGTLSPAADTLRRTLLARLRAQFGHQQVRECEWRGHRDPSRSGCPPGAPPH